MKNLIPEENIKFDEIISIIENSRTRALKAVNTELIQMYWAVGKRLSEMVESSEYGDKVILDLANYIEKAYPALKGFNRRGLYRMKQFYELYKGDEIVSAVLTQITWTNHLLIMSKCKTPEERHFYLMLCIKEQYSSRELERQMSSAYYERYMLSSQPIEPENDGKDTTPKFLDTYVLDFLNLPEPISEKNLRRAILDNLKRFILEFGKDFSLLGEEYRIRVGGEDFYIDLLFYNRALSCLVPLELKIDKFKPEYIGQLNFYLEALDRDVRKPNENPSVGLILCTGKNDTVVEYSLSRSLPQAKVAEYTFALPDKQLLQDKIKEITDLALSSNTN